MDVFPYPPRPNQLQFVKLVEEVAQKKGHLVLESGTGTGKTVCALSGTIQEALATGRKVLYLTRTNSQEEQVVRELRRINEKTPVFGLAIQGRQVTCPLIRRDQELKGGNPEELSRICGEKKKKVLTNQPGGCRFYAELVNVDHQEVESYCRANLPTAEEFVRYCDSRNVCPHELMKEMVSSATVVAAPYAYFFMPFIRHSLLDWMGVRLEELIVIIDEAHNIPDYTRDIESFELSRTLLDLVQKEVDEYGDPEILQGVSIMDMVIELRKLLQGALDEYLIEEDGLIPPSFLEEGLMSGFTASSRALEIAAKALMEHGEIVREQRIEQNRLPRSYIFSMGAFLSRWFATDEWTFVKLIVGGDNPYFKAYCLDPIVTTSVLLGCGGTVHMSGTLSPLAEYRDSIGLPSGTVMRMFPSPFPKENRAVFYTENVTTKFEEMAQDDEIIPRMEETVVQLCNVVKKNTVIFFPSYSLMERFLADKILTRIRRKVMLEERGMAQAELMDVVTRFKGEAETGAVLFSVVGGRISEGIDFPDKELQLAVIIGVPYPKPTARQRALMHYYERKFYKGWEITVKAPTSRKMLQAIGRLIRTETDIGAAVILDRRAKQFTDRIELQVTEGPLSSVLEFFDQANRSKSS